VRKRKERKTLTGPEREEREVVVGGCSRERNKSALSKRDLKERPISGQRMVVVFLTVVVAAFQLPIIMATTDSLLLH